MDMKLSEPSKPSGSQTVTPRVIVKLSSTRVFHFSEMSLIVVFSRQTGVSAYIGYVVLVPSFSKYQNVKKHLLVIVL